MKKHEIAEPHKKVLELLQPSDPNFYTEEEETAKNRYPGVPYPYCLTWERSDEEANINPERKEKLLSTAAALERAAAVCSALATPNADMTISELANIKRQIEKAIQSAEKQLMELRCDYPMPINYWHLKSRPSKCEDDFTPRLLFNSEARITFWLPPLPARSLNTSSLLFTKFSDMLYAYDFPQLGQWHCDFYHAHKDGDLKGVRDVDNYPYKPIIDALSRAFFSPDSFDNFSCAMYNISSNTLRPGCYIDVHKRSQKVGIFHEFEDYASSLI